MYTKYFSILGGDLNSPHFLKEWNKKRKEKEIKGENTNTKNCLQIKQLYSPDPPLKILFSPTTDPSLKKKQPRRLLKHGAMTKL